MKRTRILADRKDNHHVSAYLIGSMDFPLTHLGAARDNKNSGGERGGEEGKERRVYQKFLPAGRYQCLGQGHN